jgi:ubiquitin carboxyl-terminal hydrolase 22/27/51
LAGYDQQDAHEFFIASVDRIHSHCADVHKLRHQAKTSLNGANSNQPSSSTSSSSSNFVDLTTADPVKKDPDAMDVDAPVASGDANCSCIIHKSFSGLLRSDVICQSCKKGSTAYDPFFDISLDIAGPENEPSAKANGNQSSASGGAEGPVTLLDCLRKFTQPESLENFRCQNCNQKSTSTKQLSMNKLPVVICFHLKRFKQLSLISSHSTKIDTYVEFPETLDMAPFLSASMVEPNSGSSVVPTERYELFCVVNHHGKIDNGHYTCFVRHSAETWYKCDDHLITKASASEVVRSRGYLLFYVRQNLNMDADALKF